MNHRSFSVVLLPVAECNAACEYCFERKEPHRLALDLVPVLARRLLDHLDREDIDTCEIYWQGGEALLMGPEWYAKTKRTMEQAACERGRRFVHYLQTNLISYSPAWDDVIFDMFGGSLSTSMDYPNRHRKLLNGTAKEYTRIWRDRLEAARGAGIRVGVIAVLHRGSLEAGAEAFYRYFTDDLGLHDFQVNTPFPGGPASQSGSEFQLDPVRLSSFLDELFDIWTRRGFDEGINLGPFDALVRHFAGQPTRLPCIWKENCSNQFISVDARGTVAQCDCWVTSYPDYCFGNIFREADLTHLLSESPVRRQFIARPGKLVADGDCLSCRFLSVCHGGCPVRTYAASGTIHSKDPYCEVYKAIFGRAEQHGRLLRQQSIVSASPEGDELAHVPPPRATCFDQQMTSTPGPSKFKLT